MPRRKVRPMTPEEIEELRTLADKYHTAKDAARDARNEIAEKFADLLYRGVSGAELEQVARIPRATVYTLSYEATDRNGGNGSKTGPDDSNDESTVNSTADNAVDSES